jgi:hypothetical protein
MSDQTVNGQTHKQPRVPRAEYRIYFSVIFIAALPFTTAACIADLITGHETRDPIRRALAEARRITPHIFSA